MQTEIIQLDAVKVSTAVAEHSFQKTAKKLKKMKEDHIEIKNQQISLENWVEKYLPLKLQHQIVETVGEVISDDLKDKFYEISRSMAKVLRKDIIKDNGKS